MTISPYLEDLLKKWGRRAHSSKAWYSECPYMKEHIGKTKRAPIFSSEYDEVELLGLRIGEMVDALRKPLEARYKHPFKTDRARAKWCRMTPTEYRASFKESIGKLEDWWALQNAS